MIERDLTEMKGKFPASFDTYQAVESGDFVFCLFDVQETPRTIGLSRFEGMITGAYDVYRGQGGVQDRYLEKLLLSFDAVKALRPLYRGLRNTLPRGAFESMRICWPSPEEQALIVRYLDNAELRIARAVQTKRVLIARLEELAAVRRWDALTGGEPGGRVVAGVEWMGPLPSSFAPVRLKSIFSERTVRSGSGEQPLLSLRMREGLVRSSDYTGRPEDPEKLVNYKVVAPGQMVMNRMRASIGLFGVASSPGIVSPDYAVFDIREGFHPGFMLLLLKSPQCGSVIRANSRGMGTGSSGFLRIYTDAFGRLQLAVPPLAEQVARYAKAAAAAQALEEAISALRKEVALLGEYRVRLISDVVTGKKDVRVEAAGLNDVDPDELASVVAGFAATENADAGEDDDAE